MGRQSVPAWLVARERYEAPSDRGRYLEKSVLSILGVLAALRERPGAGKDGERLSPALKLLSAFLVIVLVSLSRGALFLEAAAAFELGCLCLLRGQTIAHVLRRVLAAGLFALAIFLPAFLLGRDSNLPFLCGKVLLAALAAALFSATTPWSSATAAFSALRAPDIFVMTLDLTVKYISLLGGLLLDTLYAMKLRSVGRDARKISTLAGSAGTLFLKSKEAAEAQYQAMRCRCFSGSYRVARRRGFGQGDAALADSALAAAALAVLAAFFALGASR